MEVNMFSVGIDLGGTNIAVGVVDKKGNILAKVSIPTENSRNHGEIIADMAKASKDAIEKAGLNVSDIDGIGIGSPGTVDSENGIIVYANNLKFENVPMRQELGSHIDLPVYISNDANCAALGETSDAGAAKGYKNVVLITLGTGVGGGIIIDGKIYEGNYSAGAELGHSLMVLDGEMCTCGRKGCWEAYASATALVRQTKSAMQNDRNSIMWELTKGEINNAGGRTAFDASRKGDESGLKVVNNYIKYVSEGLVDMINIFRPEIVLLGGGVSNEGEYLFSPVREYVGKYTYGGSRTPVPPVMKAKLGNDAGIIGSAMLVK